jgi:hypothetical protein
MWLIGFGWKMKRLVPEIFGAFSQPQINRSREAPFFIFPNRPESTAHQPCLQAFV